MDLLLFRESLSGSIPPQNSSVYLNALWYDAKGDWDQAHNLIQDVEDKNASWIHAYLHRKEGDIINADYWYRRAGKKRSPFSLEKEWEELVSALIRNRTSLKSQIPEKLYQLSTINYQF